MLACGRRQGSHQIRQMVDLGLEAGERILHRDRGLRPLRRGNAWRTDGGLQLRGNPLLDQVRDRSPGAGVRLHLLTDSLLDQPHYVFFRKRHIILHW